MLYLNLAGMTNKDVETVLMLGRCTNCCLHISNIPLVIHDIQICAVDTDGEWNIMKTLQF